MSQKSVRQPDVHAPRLTAFQMSQRRALARAAGTSCSRSGGSAVVLLELRGSCGSDRVLWWRELGETSDESICRALDVGRQSVRCGLVPGYSELRDLSVLGPDPSVAVTREHA